MRYEDFNEEQTIFFTSSIILFEGEFCYLLYLFKHGTIFQADTALYIFVLRQV